MENTISKLLASYDRGLLSRRELVAGLGMLVLQSTANAQSADSAGVLHATSIDHVSIQCSDLERTVNFYKDVFGLSLLKNDKDTTAFSNGDKTVDTVRLTVGAGRIAIRRTKPAGIVDHFAFGVEKLDKAAVIAGLKQQGVTAIDGPDPLFFHVTDPDGYNVQIIERPTRG
jgi:catechol 2,3-dioxygenase-like lactoylglutathione lyase family enzyme